MNARTATMFWRQISANFLILTLRHNQPFFIRDIVVIWLVTSYVSTSANVLSIVFLTLEFMFKSQF